MAGKSAGKVGSKSRQQWFAPRSTGDLEQPLGNAFTRAAKLRDAAQQPGNVRNIAQLVGERRCGGLVFQFHANIRNKNGGRAKGFNHGWTPMDTDSKG